MDGWMDGWSQSPWSVWVSNVLSESQMSNYRLLTGTIGVCGFLILYSIVNEMGRESDLGRGFIPLDYVTL
jgi:hypothetical protein